MSEHFPTAHRETAARIVVESLVFLDLGKHLANRHEPRNGA